MQRATGLDPRYMLLDENNKTETLKTVVLVFGNSDAFIPKDQLFPCIAAEIRKWILKIYFYI